MAGLYIHIPFCKSRCSYCDFYSGVQVSKTDQLVEALCAEIDKRSPYLGSDYLNTIYLGGGTPSILTFSQLSAIFKTIEAKWDISRCSEITLEANPDDLTDTKLREISELPVNRLSIGIQSFNDTELQLLRRRHTAAQAFDVVQNGSRYFNNISVDLMYGLPNQSISSWKHTISQALALNIQHISAYHLTYEPGTLLDRKLREGKLSSVSEESSLKMYGMLVDMLQRNGIEQYEISNFAQPGLEARHNSAYWEGDAYLGIGPSAHSFDGVSRQWNIANTSGYIRAIQDGKPCFEREILTQTNKYNELIMVSLRTAKGLSLEKIAQEFGINERDILLQKARRYLDNGMMTLGKNRLALTKESLFLSDGIIIELMHD